MRKVFVLIIFMLSMYILEACTYRPSYQTWRPKKPKYVNLSTPPKK